MPGSYPDPRSYTSTALQALEEAYEESHNTHLGSLILTAIQALTHLREDLRLAERSGGSLHAADPYEINELNSAI